MTLFLRRLPWVLTVAILAALPFYTSSVQYFLTSTMIWCILAIGFNLSFGVAGLMSLGHAAFYGLGAYSVALLPLYFSVPPLLALMFGTAFSAVVALLVGLISLRLSGIFLGLTTLAVAQLIEFLMSVRLSSITKGQEGLTDLVRPSLLAWSLDNNETFTLFVAAIFFAVLVFAALLEASPWGRALKAMRENELRASQLGFDVRRLKLGVFAVSGALAGLAGGLLAMLMRFVNSDLLHWTVSGDVLITVLVGGAGTLFGPVAGALLVGVIQEYVGAITDRWHGLLGLILIFVTLFMPGGLSELGKRAGVLLRGGK